MGLGWHRAEPPRRDGEEEEEEEEEEAEEKEEDAVTRAPFVKLLGFFGFCCFCFCCRMPAEGVASSCGRLGVSDSSGGRWNF